MRNVKSAEAVPDFRNVGALPITLLGDSENCGVSTSVVENQVVSELPSHLTSPMARRALAEQPNDDMNVTAASRDMMTSYALAIEPDASQARTLEQILAGRIGGTLKVVRSTEAAFATLVESLPDVILMSPLLAPQDEEQLVAHLGTLGVDASHVQLLTIPRFGDGQGANQKRRRFGWQSQKPLTIASGGCDPDAFAHEVAEYLAQASTLRRNHAAVEPAPATADTLADLRMEHIEQLLERFDVSSMQSVSEKKVREPQDVVQQEIIPQEPIHERDDAMTMTTANEVHTDATRETGEPRLPRFLTLDERVPMPLRALLDEADGCLKMSFLTGAGACTGRTLDLLLAEQGLGGADRADQIHQLGKKHPAVAESFLRGLALVTNNPSGAWDEPRVRLAIVILKAIAYEIYVLGPERKERAAYVIELLERFKSAGRS
jgi:hypothetical protein